MPLMPATRETSVWIKQHNRLPGTDYADSGVVTFPAQMLNSPTTTQTITLANNSGSTLNGLTLQWQVDTGSFDGNPSDFDGLPNFLEQDTCTSPFGSSFSLSAGGPARSRFPLLRRKAALDSVPLWRQSGGITGIAPEYCLFLWRNLDSGQPSSADGETSFAVPITGLG